MAGNGHYLTTFHTGAIGEHRHRPDQGRPARVHPGGDAGRGSIAGGGAGRFAAAQRHRSGGCAQGRSDTLAHRGGARTAQNTHMAIAEPLQVARVAIDRLTIAPFRSSGESVTALLGGHVDVVSATAPAVLRRLLAGKLQPLASAAQVRAPGALAGVKTWREPGVAADYVSYNGVMLPPGVNAEQIRFWEDAYAQGFAAKAWIALVEALRATGPIFRGYVDSIGICSRNGRRRRRWQWLWGSPVHVECVTPRCRRSRVSDRRRVDPAANRPDDCRKAI